MVEGARAETTAPRRRWLLPLVIWGSVLLAVVVLLASGEAPRMRATLARADWWWLLPLSGAALCLPVVHARRWCSLLRAVGDDISLGAALELTVTSTMVSYAAPGYLWSPAKGLLARQFHGISVARSLPTLAAEQGLDVLALLLGSLAGLAAAGSAASARLSERVASPSLRVLLASVALLVGLAVPAAWFGRRYASRFGASTAASARTLARDRSQRGAILLLTAGRWSLDACAVFCAVLAVGVHPAVGQVVLLTSLPLLIGLISPVPGGIGFREGAMAAVAAALGLPAGAVLTAAVLHRAVLLLALPVLLAIVSSWGWSRSWR